MKQQVLQHRFLALMDDSLPPAQQRDLREQIRANSRLEREFQDFCVLYQATHALGDGETTLKHDLGQAVLTRITKAEESFLSRAAAFLQSRLFFAPAAALACIGLVVLMYGLSGDTPTAPIYSGGGGCCPDAVCYNDVRLASSVNSLLTHIEGTVGAMVMVGCALLGLALLLWRRWRLAALFFFLAILAFTLRSVVGTFFNDATIQAQCLDCASSLCASVANEVFPNFQV